jgi:hypothetical protein
MPSGVRLYAVTVNWKRGDDTLECVGSLFRSGFDGIEIVVVDNGSKDGSVELVSKAYPNVKLIENDSNLGYSKAANQGITLALEGGATHILVINNDAAGCDDFVAKMLEAFGRHPKAGILGCRILYHSRPVIWYGGGYYDDWLGYSKHHHMEEPDNTEIEESATDFVTGCVMLVKAEVFRDIGLFDERMNMYCEDLDFCIRAKEKGFESWFVPSAVATHKVSATAGVMGSNKMTPYRSYYYARNMMYVVGKDSKGLKMMTRFYSQLFILLPYYFFTISMDHSKGSLRKYLSGLAKGVKMMVE